MERRLNPRNNEDFSILYNELDKWRKDEIDKIKVSLFYKYSIIRIL